MPRNPYKENNNIRLASRRPNSTGHFGEAKFGSDNFSNYESWSPLMKMFLVQPKETNQNTFFMARFFLLVLMAIFALQTMFSGAQAGIVDFLHFINLPIHETGHIVFGIFQWDWLTSLGGSLFQIIMPFVCTCALFFKTKDLFGASVGLWWTFENYVDLAPYIGDARAGVLPLLGGNTGQSAPYGFHDWQFILGEMGLSKFDTFFSGLAQYFGLVGMIAATLWGAWTLYFVKYVQK